MKCQNLFTINLTKSCWLDMELRQHDLDFMRMIMDYVNTGAGLNQIFKFTNEQVEESRFWNMAFERKVLWAYETSNLIHYADDNPFFFS